MPTAEELQEEYGLDDDQMEALKESLSPATLRTQKAALDKDVKALRDENKTLKDENSTLKKGPERLTLLKEKLGIEESSLPPAAKRNLAQRTFEAEEPTDDELAAFAADYNITATPAEGGEETKTDQVVGASNAGRQEGKASSGVIKPEEASEWSFEDRARFRGEYPKEWVALLEGKEVAVAFTPSG